MAAPAIAVIRHFNDEPDLIVMDVGLPKVNGIEATRRILAADPGARIVALSLNESGEAVKEIRSSGARAYVFKSEAFGSLRAAIRVRAAEVTP